MNAAVGRSSGLAWGDTHLPAQHGVRVCCKDDRVDHKPRVINNQHHTLAGLPRFTAVFALDVGGSSFIRTRVRPQAGNSPSILGPEGWLKTGRSKLILWAAGGRGTTFTRLRACRLREPCQVRIWRCGERERTMMV